MHKQLKLKVDKTFPRKQKKSSFLVKSLSEKARVIGTASDTPEIRARLYKH
jgi:hypothetical protein